ncbi:unnamed protein product, partial [Pleuronectes platessa]
LSFNPATFFALSSTSRPCAPPHPSSCLLLLRLRASAVAEERTSREDLNEPEISSLIVLWGKLSLKKGGTLTAGENLTNERKEGEEEGGREDEKVISRIVAF